VARVYVSLPLTGPSARPGRDLLRGAELALEQAEPAGVEPVVLDSGGEDRDGRAAANARRAAEDREALAYLGDFHSSQVLASAPVLAAAGLLTVAPVATFIGLRGATLVRLSPHDGVCARTIAGWLQEAGVQEVLVVHDHDPGYGSPVGAMCFEAAQRLGLHSRIRPVWDHDEPIAGDLGDAGAVLYVGVAGSGAVAMFEELHGLRPDLWLLGSDGIAVSWLARDLGPGPAARMRLFVAQRAPFALYGLEAISLILDAVTAGGGDRAGTVAAARATRARRSPLGRYSIDADGLTTTTAYGRLAIAGGKLVWDVEALADGVIAS
jgi:branched-chain amino acid transport system substrate-binding protein